MYNYSDRKKHKEGTFTPSSLSLEIIKEAACGNSIDSNKVFRGNWAQSHFSLIWGPISILRKNARNRRHVYIQYYKRGGGIKRKVGLGSEQHYPANSLGERIKLNEKSINSVRSSHVVGVPVCVLLHPCPAPADPATGGQQQQTAPGSSRAARDWLLAVPGRLSPGKVLLEAGKQIW